MKSLKSKIEKAQIIGITTHIHPDIDGIGSQIALHHAFKTLNKRVYCILEKKIPRRYKYLDKEGIILSYKDFVANHADDVNKLDLFIVLDTNMTKLVGKNVEKLVTNTKHLFIDHHPFDSRIDLNKNKHYIDTSCSSTGELVSNLIAHMKVPFTKTMALPLYMAIITDTSCFRYPTVTGNTHRVIAELIETGGVKPAKAYNQFFGTKKINHLQLLGEILSSAQTAKNGKIAWLFLTEHLLNKYNISVEDTNGFVNYLLVLDNIEVACMFREQNNNIKISFRSTGVINVGDFAKKLGGGGHGHSSAVIVNGEMDDIIVNIINKLKKVV